MRHLIRQRMAGNAFKQHSLAEESEYVPFRLFAERLGDSGAAKGAEQGRKRTFQTIDHMPNLVSSR